MTLLLMCFVLIILMVSQKYYLLKWCVAYTYDVARMFLLVYAVGFIGYSIGKIY